MTQNIPEQEGAKDNLYLALAFQEDIVLAHPELEKKREQYIHKTPQKIISKYSKNPFVKRAILGQGTIEESLEEIDNDEEGLIRKFLPRRKDKNHNQRVKQLEDIFGWLPQYRHRGISFPDNFVTTTLESFPSMMLLASGVNLFMNYVGGIDPGLDMAIPTFIATIMSPGLGLLSNVNRFRYAPRKEARYIDRKIKEAYPLQT